MDTNEILRKSLEHFKQLRQKKIEDLAAEIAGFDTTIRQLQIQLGEMPDEPSLPFAPPQGSTVTEPKSATQQIVVTGAYKFRPDEFFGMPQADAARGYLERIGHAMSLDDIFTAITGGGCKVGGADPKRTLLSVLGGNKRDFVNTGGGNWGLRKFYPNMPKLGRPEGSTPSKKASAKRGGAKKSVKRNAKPALKPKMEKPIEVHAPMADDQSGVVQ